MVREVEFRTADMIASFLNFIAYIITPILFIWAVNTLFDCGIATTFKTWLAGLILTMLLRFHLRVASDSYEDYDEDYYEDEEGYEDEEDEGHKAQKARLKAKLMAYQNHKSKKDSPSDES